MLCLAPFAVAYFHQIARDADLFDDSDLDEHHADDRADADRHTIWALDLARRLKRSASVPHMGDNFCFFHTALQLRILHPPLIR